MLKTRHREKRFLIECGETGQRFVVDNTNPTRAEREVYIRAATGWGQEDDKRQSREAGFNFHMVKAVDPAALEKLLAELKSETA
jgi:hypothetical protein